MGVGGGLSRRSSDWAEVEDKENDDEDDGRSRHVEDEDEAKQGLEEHERQSRDEKRAEEQGQ
jgi:hypothetical protein